MRIVWKRHARERFLERVLKYDINYAEVEMNIKNQRVREKQKGKNVFKTIFKFGDYFFTVIKRETKKLINVISLWEANEWEVKLWKKKE